MDVIRVEASSDFGTLGRTFFKAEISCRVRDDAAWDHLKQTLARAILGAFPEGIVYVQVMGPHGSGKLSLTDGVVEYLRKEHGVTARSIASRADVGMPPRVVGDDHQARFTFEVSFESEVA